MHMRFLLSVVLLLTACQVLGQVTFGRNKVQYADFDWQVMKTAHFDIYYDADMQDLASIGAAYAEEAYAALVLKFRESVTNRIPLIFYASPFHFEQTNATEGLVPPGVGGFFEFLKGRVVLPADGNLFRFRHVIRHELVHVFTWHRFHQITRSQRVPEQKFYPLWFTEGLAEYWSGDQPDAQSRMVIRDAALSGYLLPPSRFQQVNGTYYMYKLGEHFLHFLADTYGESVIWTLVENTWKATDFRENLKQATGRTAEELDLEWLTWVRRQYWPSLEQYTPAAIETGPAGSKGFSTNPRLLADSTGTWCYYVGNPRGYTSVFRVKLAKAESGEPAGSPELLVAGERTPDLEWIKPFDPGMDLHPDGDLTMVARQTGADVIYRYRKGSDNNPETRSIRSIIKIGGIDWSPDGTRLVFSGLDGSGRQDLYVLHWETGALTRLTADFFDERQPAFSPDGNWILFTTDRHPGGENGGMSPAIVRVSGGPIRLLANAETTAMQISSVRPDGTILFTSDESGPANVWSADWSDLEAGLLSDSVFSWPASRESGFSSTVLNVVQLENLLMATVYEGGSIGLRSWTPPDDSPVETHFSYSGPGWQPPVFRTESLRETVSYEPEYSLEVAQGAVYTEPLLGTVGGLAIGYGDVLGDDRWLLTVYSNAETADELLENFNVSVARLVRGNRANYALGGFHFRGRRYDLTDPDLFFRERLIGGFMAWSYPLSRFDRLETGITLAWSKKESLGYPTLYGGGLLLASGKERREALMVSNTIGYVYDNTLWAFTGPLDGYRYGVSLGYTTDFRFNNVNYYTLLADYRHYFRLTDLSTWASRLQFRLNNGQEARRFYMIGSWDIRGYPNFALRGKKLWLSNQEVRFPFLDLLLLKFPVLDVPVAAVRGALFADVGNAWDTTYPGSLGSFGAGLRWNLGGAVVLRYDAGKTWTGDPFNLDPAVFHQFFFGWDF